MRKADAETTPVNPLTLAVIVVVPRLVANCDASGITVATPGALDVQVAVSVRSCVEEG